MIVSIGSEYIKDDQDYTNGWGGLTISNCAFDIRDISLSINFFKNTNSPQYLNIWAPNDNRGYIYVTNTSMAIKYPMSSSGAEITFTDDKVVTINDVLKLEPRATPPSNPEEGMLYVNSSDHHIYCYLNGAWTQLD